MVRPFEALKGKVNMSIFSGTLEIDAQLILQTTDSKAITCYWCQKIAAASQDGRTLKEIAEFLYLPLPVACKLVLKGVESGWFVVDSKLNDVLEPPSAGHPLWHEVQITLSRAVGEKSNGLLQDAARMTKQQVGHLSLGELPNFLIALELLLSEQDRQYLLPALDGLRERHKAA